MGEKDLDKPVEEAEAGDADEGEPPPPEDEEVVLVEQVVGEKAEDVIFVAAPCRRASVNIARYLGGKKGAHWVARFCQIETRQVFRFFLKA